MSESVAQGIKPATRLRWLIAWMTMSLVATGAVVVGGALSHLVLCRRFEPLPVRGQLAVVREHA
jgi:hypothetical protein